MTLDNVAYHLANGKASLMQGDLAQADIGFDRGLVELDEMKKKLDPVVAAAKGVHEARQRMLGDNSLSAQLTMDVAWDALTKALKDLG